jgi:hypothetical protein
MKRTKFKLKCQLHSAFKDQFGDERYYPCPHTVRFVVSFISAVQGDLTIYNVCGVHKNSLEKMCARIDKHSKTEYSKFKIIQEFKKV